MNDKTLVERLRDRGVCSIAQNSCRNDYICEEAATRIEALEAALHFYADYHPQPSEGPWGANSKDFGDVARKALEGSGND